jgi:hypothetical protein
VEAEVEHFPDLLEERADHPFCLIPPYQVSATLSRFSRSRECPPDATLS